MSIVLKSVLVIFNPNAGAVKRLHLHEQICALLKDLFAVDFLLWDHPEQDLQADIKLHLQQKEYTAVIAAGGDGTVNAVASALVQSKVPLLILPIGSGNGLARHLKIPLQWQEALSLLTNGKIVQIDTATVNGKAFFCTSGIGFDAHIGHLFAKASTRGLFTYVKLTLKELCSYKADTYTITIDGTTHKTQAFLITIANANQWGNDIRIAPMASITDGLLHVVCMHSFKLFHLPQIAFQLMTRTIKMNKRFSIYKGKEITICHDELLEIHYDGEASFAKGNIKIDIHPQSLFVFVK